nr:UvrD-helicase domain-containing protein [Pseudomonadota bacterium]
MTDDALHRLDDVFLASLAGVNLIEASAGTGKTYTITGLYLRLVLEAGIRVDRILVVTYTRAATEELRDRIRQRLAAARAAFAGGDTDDAFCRTLLERHPDREAMLKRLVNAVRGFDEAAIHTIHGFCQRVLEESAFESGMPFETEVLPDDRRILQEIVDDFWRREVYEAPLLRVEFLLDEKISPEKLFRDVRPHVGKPYLRVLGPPQTPDLEAAEAAFAAAYHQVRGLWQADGPAVQALLMEDKGLNRSKYSLASLPGWLRMLDDYLAPPVPRFNVFPHFEKFTAGSLSAAVKKGGAPLEHPFFAAGDRLAAAHKALADAYQYYLRALRVRLLCWSVDQLKIRKQRLQVQSYDDLLLNLHQALHAGHGGALIQTVRRRYAAALIDEFQDTDPVQYDIFRRLYGDAGAPVFLVGDPKQAIYSFRGADIFAYLRARHDAGRRYTLDVNWRSDPQLLRALNALYARARRPFLFAEIPYTPARPAPMEREAFQVDGDDAAPLRVWFVGWNEKNKPTTKGETADLAARATAAEIARLLNLAARGRARVGGRALAGGDMAVLVRSHRQGRQMRRELLRLGVPSVQQARESVFKSPESLDLERVLLAVAEPSRERLVRAALATELMGVSGEDIQRLGEDDAAWEVILESFLDWHRLWLEHGFARLFRDWFARQDVARRLLEYRDGERRLTNLLHLAELIQAEASRSRLGPEGVIEWLAGMRRTADPEGDEEQLRLESDEHLVKIVTVHKSKGLEYPLVFCPFLWDSNIRNADDGVLTFHDPQDGYRAILDLGSPQQKDFRPHAAREELAENLRLLYVALT